MSNNCFVTQIANSAILMRVTHLCGRCYVELKEGDVIHYDMQEYRFLCDSCQKVVAEAMQQEREATYDGSVALTLFE